MNNRRRRHAKRIRKAGGVRGRNRSEIIRGLLWTGFTYSERELLLMLERNNAIVRTYA